MADLKISELSALAGGNLVAADELAIVDDSASETKKITVSDLVANGVTLISDDTIPGAKILFGAGDIATAALADAAVTTAKVADDAITAAKLANESTVDLVTTLPASGAFTGQLALDTDDNSLYAWDGSAWQSIAAPASVNTVSGSTTGEINIVAATSGSTVTISATIDDTTSAAQFLAGPTGSAGAVGYRTIGGGDLPAATASTKGGVIVNGNGLVMDGDTIEIDNVITSSATHHVVTYDANGLITGGRVITSADLPFATETTIGAVSVGDGLAVGAAGELSVDNTVTPGEYTKVTVTAQGLVSSATTLADVDIPDHSAAKLTSGTIGTSLIANDAITADKFADQSITKFGGAAGSDNVTIFPNGDFQGQFFYDETTQDLYIYTGSSFVPITVLSGNLVNAGAYNGSTNQMSSVTSAGSSAGFSVGASLPAPAQTNLNHYVVVDTSGTGTGAAPAVALAPPDMLLSQGVGTEYSLIDVSNAIAGQTASNISLIATGNLIATDVQAGIQELDSEKLQKAGDTMTGALGIGTASSIVFEGSTADDYETTLTVTDPTADRSIVLPDVSGNVVTTGDTGTVTSAMITDGTIVNADINASAEIAVSKLANGTARQLLQTDAAGTGVEFTSNVDVPGTLDVTSAATFDSTVTATGLITANGKVSFPAGTAAAPSLHSGTDIDTGIYAPAANEFGVATAGTSRLVIDNSGNVGIGTSSPSQLLHVQGTSATRMQITGGSAATTSINFGDTDDEDIGQLIYDNASNSLQFVVNAGEKVRIDSSGNVGIGTSAPQAKLEVAGNAVIGTDNAGLVEFTSTGIPYFAVAADASNYRSTRINVVSGGGYADLSFDAMGTAPKSGLPSAGSLVGNIMYLDASAQRVGIGTTSPSSPLSISDGGAGGVEFHPNSGGQARLLAYNRNTSSYIGMKYNANYHQFLINDSEKALIDSSGRLLVGTSTARTNVVGQTPHVLLEKVNGSILSLINNQASANDAQLLLGKTRGSSIGSNTVVQNGDAIGLIAFCGNDGSIFREGASIRGFVDGTPGSGDMPSRLVFSTTADGASSPTNRAIIDNAGRFKVQGVYDNTTVAAANVWVDTDGSLRRSTSSIKYKIDVETLQDKYADAILNIRPVWYRSTAPFDNPNWGWWGFIAEEVAAIDSRLVQWKTSETKAQEDGSLATTELENPEPEGVQYDRFVPHLLNLIKRQKEQIEAQGTAIAALEARLSALEAQ